MQNVRGSSLIEALVALAVFAIGSASTATWMMQSMAIDARASRLVAATTIAVSLEARMRSNRAAALAGSYTEAARGHTETKDARARECDDGCDSAALARDDLRVFRFALARRIGPAAAGSAACHPSGACVTRIAWAGHDILVWPFYV